MGEIADSMLDGELCMHCGVYLGDGVGHTRLCFDCEELDRQVTRLNARTGGKALYMHDKVPCPHCKKMVCGDGLDQHISAKHGEKS